MNLLRASIKQRQNSYFLVCFDKRIKAICECKSLNVYALVRFTNIFELRYKPDNFKNMMSSVCLYISLRVLIVEWELYLHNL